MREKITQYQAGEISRLPNRQELREQFGYRSNTPFYKTLRRAGVLEEWREAKKEGRKAKKSRKKNERTHYDNSGIEQNIPPILRDTHGRVVWKLPDSAPEENEQLGIRNFQALFLTKIPEFNELFPRGEDGAISEERRGEAIGFITNRLKTYREFIKIFGRSPTNRKITPYFNGSHIIAIQKSFFPWGLKFERSEFGKSGRAEISLSNESLIPSHEIAWIIGVLVGGGYSNPTDKRVSIDSNNKEFLNAFKTVGEGVFGVNGAYRTRRKPDGEREYKGVTFHSRKVALMLGDLRSPEWPTTIINQHKWIIENLNYLWSFIEGIFERRGNVSMGNNRIKGVFISTDFANVANFLAELLVRLGIERPLIEHNRRGKEGVKGIRFYNRQDLKHFADNVHSRMPEKENRLSACRDLKRYDRSRSTSSVVATQETQIFP